MAQPSLADNDEEEQNEENTSHKEETDTPSELFDGVDDQDSPDEEETPSETEDEPENEPENEVEEDPDEQLVELDEETVSMFDGVEDSETSPDDSESETTEEDEPANPFGEGDELNQGVGAIVIETAAEAACLGLDEETTKENQPQYESLFETMRLGYFSQRVFEEKIMEGGDKDIDPVWGLLASAIICAFIAVWMRPDRDKHIQAVKDVFNGDTQ